MGQRVNAAGRLSDRTLGIECRTTDDPGRAAELVALVAAYAKAQGMYRVKTTPDPMFTDILQLELGPVEPSLSVPKRPQDRTAPKELKTGFAMWLDKDLGQCSQAQKTVQRYG